MGRTGLCVLGAVYGEFGTQTTDRLESPRLVPARMVDILLCSPSPALTLKCKVNQSLLDF
jgi:hypothetical protein